MKNIIVALLCLGILSGCKKSDQQAKNPSIIGRWTLIKSENTIYNVDKLVLDTITNFSSGANYFQFNTDGTGITNVSQIDNNRVLTGTGAFTYYIQSGSFLSLTYNSNKAFIERVLIYDGDNKIVLHNETFSGLITGVGASSYYYPSGKKQVIDETYAKQ